MAIIGKEVSEDGLGGRGWRGGGEGNKSLAGCAGAFLLQSVDLYLVLHMYFNMPGQ